MLTCFKHCITCWEAGVTDIWGSSSSLLEATSQIAFLADHSDQGSRQTPNPSPSRHWALVVLSKLAPWRWRTQLWGTACLQHAVWMIIQMMDNNNLLDTYALPSFHT